MSEPITIVLDGKTIAEVVRRENAKYELRNGGSEWQPTVVYGPRPEASASPALSFRQRIRLIKRALT